MLSSLAPEAMEEAIRYASVESFQAVAILPLLLLPVFGLIWFYDHKKTTSQSAESTLVEG